jgi:hypothetical protein
LNRKLDRREGRRREVSWKICSDECNKTVTAAITISVMCPTPEIAIKLALPLHGEVAFRVSNTHIWWIWSMKINLSCDLDFISDSRLLTLKKCCVMKHLRNHGHRPSSKIISALDCCSMMYQYFRNLHLQISDPACILQKRTKIYTTQSQNTIYWACVLVGA